VKPLDDRVAVITGAANGVGRGIAEVLAAEGAKVALADIDAAAAEALAAELTAAGRDALAVTTDVTDSGSVEAMAATVVAEWGRIDILAANAGIYPAAEIPEIDDEFLDRVLAINVKGTVHSIRACLPAMRERGYGRIVTISSGAGLDGGSEACAHYAASKGGVIALTKALAKEYVRDGVLVNVVAPRAVRTPMLGGMTDGMDELVPVGRIGEPDDVAAAVAFLCSAHASYVSGEVVVLNGGWW